MLIIIYEQIVPLELLKKFYKFRVNQYQKTNGFI